MSDSLSAVRGMTFVSSSSSCKLVTLSGGMLRPSCLDISVSSVARDGRPIGQHSMASGKLASRPNAEEDSSVTPGMVESPQWSRAGTAA